MTDKREAIHAAYQAACRTAASVLFADPEYAAARAAYNAAQTALNAADAAVMEAYKAAIAEARAVRDAALAAAEETRDD